MVDLQGFKKPVNEFVPKKLAALEVNNSNNNELLKFGFESLCDWNIQVESHKFMAATKLSWNNLEFWKCPVRSCWVNHLLNFAMSMHRLRQGLGQNIWLSSLIEKMKKMIDLDGLECRVGRLGEI